MRCWWAINPFGGLKRKSARRFLQPMCAILPACPKQRSTSCFATGFWTAAGDDGPGADGIYIYIYTSHGYHGWDLGFHTAQRAKWAKQVQHASKWCEDG